MKKSIVNTVTKQPAWLLRVLTHHYCKSHHHKGVLCPGCRDLLDFEEVKSQHCGGCHERSTCSRQCYPAARRLQINHIVRWAEPKLRWRKPFIIAKHLLGIKAFSSR